MPKASRNPKQKCPYTLSLTLGDKVYTSKGATCLEALRSLERPHKIMAKGILVLTLGEKRKQLVLMPQKLKRVFYPIAQRIWAKNLESCLK